MIFLSMLFSQALITTDYINIILLK